MSRVLRDNIKSRRKAYLNSLFLLYYDEFTRNSIIKDINNIPCNKELLGYNKIQFNTFGEIIVTSLSQYLKLLRVGFDDFDFSKLNLINEDIQNLDLSNLGLDIDLENIFIPSNTDQILYGSFKDDFVFLNNSNLKGNNVFGELKSRLRINEDGSVGRVCNYIYSEDTFDDKYKSEHPEYFLDINAPLELKNKYYNPLVIYEYKNSRVYHRQSLTYYEFLKYYDFLKDKYIEKFNMSKVDCGRIKLVLALGFETIDLLLHKINVSNINLELFYIRIGNMSLEEIRTRLLVNKNNCSKQRNKDKILGIKYTSK